MALLIFKKKGEKKDAWERFFFLVWSGGFFGGGFFWNRLESLFISRILFFGDATVHDRGLCGVC
jgi:hypothetical protein